MKRIFITESQEKILREMINESLSSNTPLKLREIYENTPLKNIIPEKYSEKILEKRDEELSNVVKKLFPSIDLSNTPYDDIISKLLTNIIKTEENIKEFLEKMCLDSINDMFAIPEGVVNVDCSLVNSIDNNGSFIHINPSIDIEFDSISEAVDIDNEIEKRMLLNLIIIGASIVLTKHLLAIKKDEIINLDNTLYDNYRRLLWINEYNLSKNIPQITDDKHCQGGVVLVKLGNEKRQTNIESKAQCLPILLYETMKGLFELFISHGLPSDRQLSEYIIDQADLLKYESYAMVIGPILWNKIMSIMHTNNIDTNILPFFFKEISSLSYDDLKKIVSEILLSTKMGRQHIEDLLLSIQDDIDYHDFEERMNSKRNNKNILNDSEYLSDEELI